ncbi:MAG: hypothetical protein N2422_06845 [Rhodobacteraceae bacterium]|nr:hypothetical protein [Paracoccaceae bacterium]
MHAILVFVHLFGLMLGAAGGMSTALIMRRAAAAPAEQAQALRGLGPMLANVSAVGLGLMWLSGLVLVWTFWGGPGGLPGMFWVKFAFVLALTAATVAILMTHAAIRRGETARAALLPRLGPAAGLSSLLAVLFAVLAFAG